MAERFGAEKSKLIIGLQVGGRGFTLRHKNNNGVGAPAAGFSYPATYTNRLGSLAYYEV